MIAQLPPVTSYGQVAILVIAVPVGAIALWRFGRELRGKDRTPNLAPLLVRLEGAINALSVQQASTQKALDRVVIDMASISAALASVTLTLARLVERLENVPTKLDLVEQARENREAIRGMIRGSEERLERRSRPR